MTIPITRIESHFLDQTSSHQDHIKELLHLGAIPPNRVCELSKDRFTFNVLWGATHTQQTLSYMYVLETEESRKEFVKTLEHLCSRQCVLRLSISLDSRNHDEKNWENIWHLL